LRVLLLQRWTQYYYNRIIRTYILKDIKINIIDRTYFSNNKINIRYICIFFKQKVDVLTPSGSILTDWVENKLASVWHAISTCVCVLGFTSLCVTVAHVANLIILSKIIIKATVRRWNRWVTKKFFNSTRKIFLM